MSRRKLTIANNPLLSGPTLSERAKPLVPYREVDLSTIDRDPNQPRVHFEKSRLEELSSSIETYGVLNPLVVRISKDPGRYTLIAGERRLRASRMAGLKQVPVIISETDTADENILAIQLVENLQRDDLTPLERANAIGVLKEQYGLSIRQVAERIGISKSMVQRSLDILDLPEDLVNALREGASESKILILSKIEDLEERAVYLRELDELTRGDLKAKIQSQTPSSGAKATSKKLTRMSPEDMRIVDEIQRSLGMKVSMTRTSSDSESGKIAVEFYSEDDLQELFRKLVAED